MTPCCSLCWSSKRISSSSRLHINVYERDADRDSCFLRRIPHDSLMEHLLMLLKFLLVPAGPPRSKENTDSTGGSRTHAVYPSSYDKNVIRWIRRETDGQLGCISSEAEA